MDQATKKKVAASLRSAAAKLLARAKSPEQAAAEMQYKFSTADVQAILAGMPSPKPDIVDAVGDYYGYEPRGMDMFFTRLLGAAARKGYEEGYKAGLADGASEEKFQR